MIKKVICIIIAIILTVPAFAADNTVYADKLNELGLFNGTDKGYELENSLTREQAAVMLVRLLGAEEEAKEDNYSEKFTDVPKDRWSFPYVMYCYENDITNGTGKNKFSPETEISPEQFAALVLRTLGYEAAPETSLDSAVSKMLFSAKKATELAKSDKLLRGDMVYIIYRALGTKTADGEIFAYSLADRNVIDESQAEEFDIYKNAKNIDDILNWYFS